MKNFHGDYKLTKTTAYFLNFNKFLYILGLPNFWVEDLDFSDMFRKIFDMFHKLGNLGVFAMILSEYLAFFTQKNLTERQTSDLLLFTISHSIFSVFIIRITHQENKIRDVMYKLAIGLKEVYNHSEIEHQMIKRSKLITLAIMFNCMIAVIMYTVEAVIRVIQSGVTFNTIIIAWSDVKDEDVTSNIIRTIFNIFWWIFLTRIIAVYSLVMFLFNAVSHQFKNLNSYFYDLNDIFDDDRQLTEREKEEEFEKALKLGISLHSETLKCTSQIQTIFRDVFSGQIIFNLTILIVLMLQMVNSARNLSNLLSIATTAIAILINSGFFMWNAGDITVEAEILPMAMFSSGWENCRHEKSVRVRKLIFIAMMQAQKPVVLTGFGLIALSYQSYVSIIKSAYSVFSVLY